MAVQDAPLYRFAPLGAARAVFYCKQPEVVLSGPAGTGKSRACLEKLHLCALKYDGMRGLIVRKTRTSVTESAQVTFESKVLPPGSGLKLHQSSQQYRYQNGSVVAVAGLDKPSKIMSSEWDLIYAQEATELTENDWESLSTRLRNGVMPYQQLLGDCNPNAPTHWLKQRADRNRLTLLESRHDDNPELWDQATAAWTPEGQQYIQRLDALTGVRLHRLRWGRWVAAEGTVYEGWDPAIHLVDRFEIPSDWPRYWVVDFGYTNPFVWQAWTEDPDGRLYRYREIYRTQRLVEDHARLIAEVTRDEPAPEAIICDHDAEDRATLERHLGMATRGAHKDISPGIQAVATRLRPAGDGKPRLFYLRGSLVERDPLRDEARRPAATEEEFDTYVWDTASGRRTGEVPLKRDDHGMDATRYLVAYVDSQSGAGGQVVALRTRAYEAMNW